MKLGCHPGHDHVGISGVQNDQSWAIFRSCFPRVGKSDQHQITRLIGHHRWRRLARSLLKIAQL